MVEYLRGGEGGSGSDGEGDGGGGGFCLFFFLSGFGDGVSTRWSLWCQGT